MKTPHTPAGGKPANHPPESSGIPLVFITPGAPGKPPSVSLHAPESSGIVKGVKRSPFKRSGKSAQRPGFALWEMLNWLAAAAIVWAIFGAVIYGLMVYATR